MSSEATALFGATSTRSTIAVLLALAATGAGPARQRCPPPRTRAAAARGWRAPRQRAPLPRRRRLRTRRAGATPLPPSQRLEYSAAASSRAGSPQRGHRHEQDARLHQRAVPARVPDADEYPELTDLSKEPQHILDQYGVKQPGDGSFASNCLLARRLAERGVRFVQLYHRGWDHHGDIEKNMPVAARETDQASAALLLDLKQRGMLEDTLVIWGGEFGRTPMGQGTGRDHHINAFSLWLAGGGIKGGITHGATDELGYRSVENVVTMHDLHATMLALCGIDHQRFSVKFQGLDARLTGVEPANVVKEIVA